MAPRPVADGANYQQSLMNIIQTLPTERIRQIVDYARFIQTQTLDEPTPHLEETKLNEEAVFRDGDPLDQEILFFEAQHSQLVKEYLGQHIAMFQGQVIAHHDELETLFKKVRETHPTDVVLYRQVEEMLPPTLVFRSPRMVDM